MVKRNPFKNQIVQNIFGIKHLAARITFFLVWLFVIGNVINGEAGGDPVETALTLVLGGPWAGFIVAVGVGILVEVTRFARRALGRQRPNEQSEAEDHDQREDPSPERRARRFSGVSFGPSLLPRLAVGVAGAATLIAITVAAVGDDGPEPSFSEFLACVELEDVWFLDRPAQIVDYWLLRKMAMKNSDEPRRYFDAMLEEHGFNAAELANAMWRCEPVWPGPTWGPR